MSKTQNTQNAEFGSVFATDKNVLLLVKVPQRGGCNRVLLFQKNIISLCMCEKICPRCSKTKRKNSIHVVT